MKKDTPKRLKFLALCSLAAATLATGGYSIKAKADESSFSDSQKKEIGTIIHDYLMENPQIIFDAAEQYRQNQEEIMAKQFDDKFNQYKADLTSGPYTPFVGPEDADIVVIEFFDFNCGYCKKAYPDMKKLIGEEKDVKFIFKEMPILSPSSRTTAEWALAANKQGKYWEFHQKLIMYPGSKDAKSLEKLAADVGLDVDQLKKDLKDPKIKEEIDQNLKITRELGINGTPAFIIGKTLARGYMGYDSMKDTIDRLRDDKG